MGFNREIQKAKDPRLPSARRYVALRSAITKFSPSGFSNTFANLESAVGVSDVAESWTGDQLALAADLLAKSRDLYMVNRAHWDDERRRNKSNGLPSATKAELEARDGDSWFDSVSGGTKRRYAWISLSEWVEREGLTPAPFGPELAQDLEIVRNAMPAGPSAQAGEMIAQYGPYPSLSVPANVIAIPYRVYTKSIPDSDYDLLSATQKAIADCLYSRSDDGYMRQRHLRRIVALQELWVIPYVVAAIGDYVAEVVQEVEAGLSELDQTYSWQESSYRLFAEHNTDLIQLVHQRSISYWNCYYSHRFALDDGTELRPRYPSFTLLDSIGRPNYGPLYRSTD